MTVAKATKKQVFKACDLLVSQGRKVTLENVIALTGGSKGTVAKCVKAWRDKNPGIKHNPKQFIPMPNEVIEKSYETWAFAVMQAEQKTESD